MGQKRAIDFGQRCSALEVLGWVCFMIGLALPADFSLASFLFLGLARVLPRALSSL